MQQFLLGLQIVSAFLLIVFILVQSKGKGFGRAWGGSSSFTRRGLEKVVFKATFIVAAIFIVASLVQFTIDVPGL